ncbi:MULTISPECIES: DUF6988 family protein [Rhodanobacter]|uniref:DUF6988 family protein n=1 Tax=Rhodanobacter TaxID=75309 RepID=UPI0006847B4B|nr:MULTISPECIES: hypothetical protein [Rhodanobacter]UJJ49834.1 hypothetical protein LRK52_11385 [Rhodanobacter denitrificans]UJM92547.1 hypothetical protein LRK32_11295 [Rhodanobacter denitrificans]UJM96077.1 hypothetical protein LRK44_11300 [Rhodanobacter denitrificans]UJN21092.1 hypothetical protein LRK54_15340 [Rhodanobacter denitrificans]
MTEQETVWPPYIASPEVQHSLAIAKQVAVWNEETLYGIEVPTNDISRLGIASFAMVHEHQKSALLLTELGLMASSMALMRPMFEAYVRGLWLVYATQEEFNQYQAGRDSLDLERAIKLILSRSGKSRFNDALEMWKLSKKTLHGYVHNSFQALIRRSGLIELPTADVVSTLNFSSALATLASIEITEIMDSDALPDNKAAVRAIVNSLQADLVATLAEMGLIAVATGAH